MKKLIILFIFIAITYKGYSQSSTKKVDTDTIKFEVVKATAIKVGNTGDTTYVDENGIKYYSDGVLMFQVKQDGVIYLTDKLELRNIGLGTGLINITTGTNNIGIGYSSLYANQTGTNNIGIGYSSLYATTGSGNSGVGYNVLASNTTGSNNSAFGVSSLDTNVDGAYNSSYGYASMTNNTSGNNNIGLGFAAGFYSTTQSNRLYINSLLRNNLFGDSTKSIIYGLQNANTNIQQLRLNVGQLFIKGGNNDYKIQTDTTGKIDYTAGTSSTFVRVSGIKEDFLAYATTSGTEETDLYIDTIRAKELANNGDKMIFNVKLQHTGSSTITCYFGSATKALSLGNYTGYGDLEFTVIKTSINTAKIFVKELISNSNFDFSALTSQDFTINNVFKITGTNSAGTTTALFGYIEYKPAGTN